MREKKIISRPGHAGGEVFCKGGWGGAYGAERMGGRRG